MRNDEQRQASYEFTDGINLGVIEYMKHERESDRREVIGHFIESVEIKCLEDGFFYEVTDMDVIECEYIKGCYYIPTEYYSIKVWDRDLGLAEFVKRELTREDVEKKCLKHYTENGSCVQDLEELIQYRLTHEEFTLLDGFDVYDKANNLIKPKQYQIGIDTFKRAEANMSVEERMSCVKFGIDKYNWRDKGQDLSDLIKIIAYAEWGIEQLKENK